MKYSPFERKTYLVLGGAGLVVLVLAATDRFPYLATSPFDFALPNYAAY